MPDSINDVRPFRALHYDPAVVKDIGLCLSQPYDVISPAAAGRLLPAASPQRHPPHPQQGSSPATGRRATATHARATSSPSGGSEGILRATVRPSFWVYEQEFDLPGIGRKKVKGFIGAVRLRDYAERRILPHEKVLKGPLEDRIRLTEATNTQFEYIWSLYQDKAYVIDNILDEQEKEAPIIDYVEQPIGVRHRMWRLTDPANVRDRPPHHGAPEDLHRRRAPPLPDHAHHPRPDAAALPRRGPRRALGVHHDVPRELRARGAHDPAHAPHAARHPGGEPLQARAPSSWSTST